MDKKSLLCLLILRLYAGLCHDYTLLSLLQPADYREYGGKKNKYLKALLKHIPLLN